MYNFNDKPAAIKEVQGYLRGIGYDSLPVIISGIYDDNTSLAVKDFQTKNALFPSGKVDYPTFTILYENYRARNEERRIREKHGSFIAFPLALGAIGKDVEYINDLLISILDYYGHYHDVRRGGYFSQATEDAVITVQELFNIEKTGIINELTFGRMITERDSIFNFKV